MESPEIYLASSNMQRRDTIELIVEFSCELSNIRGKCIDIGCGPGQITKDILLPFLPEETEIVGADISEEMINYARKNYVDKRLSYIVMDIESDLSSDQIECYENITSFYCLHWCKDIRRTFENMYKLLRPQGTALIMFLSYHVGFEAYLRLKENPRFQSYMQDVCRYCPYFQKKRYKDIKTTAEKMLIDTGFKSLHCSNRKKSFRYSKQSLGDSACAVNPFIKRLSDENLKKDFIEQFVKEITFLNQNVPLKKAKENQEEYVTLPYYVLVAYVQKPLSTV